MVQIMRKINHDNYVLLGFFVAAAAFFLSCDSKVNRALDMSAACATLLHIN